MLTVSQVSSCDAVRTVLYVLRRTSGNDAPPLFTTVRAEVYDMVSLTYHVHIVLYYHNAVSQVDKPAESAEQHFYVARMEACRWLIKDEERVLLMLHSDIIGQFQSLVLSAGESGGALSQGDVS